MLTDELEISLPTSAREANHSIGPGSRLRKIREAKHFTVDEMAKRIRLNPERLMQIENDDYLLMGAPTFAKGYLRAYASQLGLVKEEIFTILQAFDDLGLGADIQHNKPELIHEKIDQNTPKVTRWVSYLIVALLLGLLAYLWHGHFNNFNRTTNTDKPAESVETTAPTMPDTTNNQVSVSIPDKAKLQTSPTQSTPVDTKTTVSSDIPPTDLDKISESPTPIKTKAKVKSITSLEE